MIQLLNTPIDERTTPAQLETIRRNIVDALREMQKLPIPRIIKDVTLADGIATPVPHGLGRRVTAIPSAARGPLAAGWIEEVRDGSHDPTKFVVLKATDFGATVTVDLVVY